MQIERQTDRAVLVEIQIDTVAGLTAAKVWFPKSQTGRFEDEEGEFIAVEGFFLRKKIEDLANSVRGFRWLADRGIVCFDDDRTRVAMAKEEK